MTPKQSDGFPSGIGITNESSLRVSVATYNQVIFRHPEADIMMLALERKATALKDGTVSVRSQPFGGESISLIQRLCKGLLEKYSSTAADQKSNRIFAF